MIEWLAELPPVVIYTVIGLGAAVENVFPPVPADTFVLLGAVLAGSGSASPWLVFLATWVANVASAVGVYLLAYRFGEGFFTTTVGHWLLKPRQLSQIGRFYGRWGVPAVFVSRFLPAFRALVPVFAGVTRTPLRRIILPLSLASALWYGALVYLGAMAGRNLDVLVAFFDDASRLLVLVAAILLAAVAAWWWRSRHGES
ncbi:MAG TPA: DedA family protein [Longimicrobiales bacterium]|nr:DedA family protein [Longimicrobiales bacterium]